MTPTNRRPSRRCLITRCIAVRNEAQPSNPLKKPLQAMGLVAIALEPNFWGIKWNAEKTTGPRPS